MSGETEREVSGWTVDTLKSHYDTVLGLQGKAVDAALASAEKAVTKAEESDRAKFESVNEFRNTLSDQQDTFLRRAEAEVRFTAMDEKLASIQRRLDTASGSDAGTAELRRTLMVASGLVVTTVGVAVAVLVAVLG